MSIDGLSNGMPFNSPNGAGYANAQAQGSSSSWSVIQRPFSTLASQNSGNAGLPWESSSYTDALEQQRAGNYDNQRGLSDAIHLLNVKTNAIGNLDFDINFYTSRIFNQRAQLAEARRRNNPMMARQLEAQIANNESMLSGYLPAIDLAQSAADMLKAQITSLFGF